MGWGFDAAKCETTCRLAIGRIKILRNKRSLALNAQRKEIATLLAEGKQDYGRIRIESVLRDENTLQAFELLELFLELLAVRAPLVASTKEIPRDMVEALSSVLYAAAGRAPDLPELTTLHKLFVGKYGKEYVEACTSDATADRWNVNERLRRLLALEPPDPAVKLQAMSEIAQAAGVEWDVDRARREMLPGGGGGGGAGGAGAGGGGGGYGAAVAAAPGGVAPPAVAPSAAPAAAAPAPPVQYANAAQAAAAAAAAAADAQRAADYARRAAEASGSGGGGGGAGGGGGGLGAALPPSGWLGTAPPAAPPPAYHARSYEELQSAYNAAQGPPEKGGVAPAAAPAAAAAPPPAPQPQPDAPPEPAAAAAATPSIDELPPAPRPGGPARPAGGDSELDELHRRLEALKRQG